VGRRYQRRLVVDYRWRYWEELPRMSMWHYGWRLFDKND
jgi:hypothetical protein